MCDSLPTSKRSLPANVEISASPEFGYPRPQGQHPRQHQHRDGGEGNDPEVRDPPRQDDLEHEEVDQDQGHAGSVVAEQRHDDRQRAGERQERAEQRRGRRPNLNR